MSDKRTCLCGQICSDHVGSKVTLMGWVDRFRDHKGAFFIDLRDKSGVVQVVLDISKHFKEIKEIKEEYVIQVKGVVEKRPNPNPKIATGAFEVHVEQINILSSSESLPFQKNANEETRLQYRYIDLRNPQLQKNLKVRHKLYQSVRNYLCEEQFLEIETPILYKSTPEGARDYLVPSRIDKGHFYALVQSPQILKQLLMVGGLDRYFQIARCFRDEDLRADRQPEFTQIDIEMSFVNPEDVMELTEGMIRRVWKDVLDIDIPTMKRISYQEAMDRYGTDRPDTRFGELCDFTKINEKISNRVQGENIIHGKPEGHVVKGIIIPNATSLSKTQLKKLFSSLFSFCQGMPKCYIESDLEGKLGNPILEKIVNDKNYVESINKEFFKAINAKHGDYIYVLGGTNEKVCKILGQARLELAQKFNLIDNNKFEFVWVTDFPLLHYDDQSKRFASAHHPFTSPTDESAAMIDQIVSENTNISEHHNQIMGLKAKAYDLVCNGHEIGGGSARIHQSNLQQKVFKLLKLTDQEIQDKFGFFIDALRYGTPPHGGIAMGLDRIAMLLAGTEAIRDVIAFPKTTSATCLMSNAPNQVSKEQLSELGLEIKK